MTPDGWDWDNKGVPSRKVRDLKCWNSVQISLQERPDEELECSLLFLLGSSKSEISLGEMQCFADTTDEQVTKIVVQTFDEAFVMVNALSSESDCIFDKGISTTTGEKKA